MAAGFLFPVVDLVVDLVVVYVHFLVADSHLSRLSDNNVTSSGMSRQFPAPLFFVLCHLPPGSGMFFSRKMVPGAILSGNCAVTIMDRQSSIESTGHGRAPTVKIPCGERGPGGETPFSEVDAFRSF